MKLSIITPTYNSEKYIENTLLSVMSQLPEDAEHIVYDGLSKDSTNDILKKYSALYNLQYISEKDKNLCEAVNKGFIKSKGDIIGWISSDNLYEEDTFNKVIKTFENNPSIEFIYGNCLVINEKGESLYDYWDSDFLKNITENKKEITTQLNHEHFLNINPGLMVPDCCYFMKRSLYNKLGYIFNDKYPTVMDYELWLRITKLTHPFYIPSVLGRFRIRKGQVSSSNLLNSWSEILKINSKFGGKLFSPLKYLFISWFFRALIRKIIK